MAVSEERQMGLGWGVAALACEEMHKIAQASACKVGASGTACRHACGLAPHMLCPIYM